MLKYKGDIMFLKRGYLDSLSEAQYANLLTTTNHLGIDPESGDPFLVPLIDRTVGTHIMGVPHSGKSALMESLAIQDILNNQAVIFIDPHGDSIDHILS